MSLISAVTSEVAKEIRLIAKDLGENIQTMSEDFEENVRLFELTCRHSVIYNLYTPLHPAAVSLIRLMSCVQVYPDSCQV